MKRSVCLLLFVIQLHATLSREEKIGDYIPYYTGSLLSTPGENMPVGIYNMQPYLFITTNYGVYNDTYKIVGIQNLTAINPLVLWQTGITEFMDIQLQIQWFHKTRGGEWSTQFGDSTFTLGFQLHRTKYGDPIPTLRFTIIETFPTGKYRNLKREKLRTDLSGAGSFQTQLGINAQKTYYWSFEHPVRFRFNFGFTIPSKVRITGFNNYGGNETTNGRLFPGYSILVLLSPEISITQNWVVTSDFIYTHRFEGNFRGTQEIGPGGLEPTLTIQSGDIFTMTPSIEYNFNQDLGIIWGGFLSIFGRNNIAFYSGVFSVVYNY